MLFVNTLIPEALPAPLIPFSALIFCEETDTKVYNTSLAALLLTAREDIAAQRKCEEAEPVVSAAVLARVLQTAAEKGAPRHLLSDGLSALLYYANHNARGGLFGLVGTEIASKIGHVPREDYDNAPTHTEAAKITAAAIAAVAEALDYDDDFVGNYRRRAGEGETNAEG